MRDWRTIGSKRVWTSERHHYVLEAWAETCTKPHTLVTFDSHTDTQNAFRRRGSTPTLDWRSLPEVRSVIPSLWHDEHIDAALKAGYLDRVLIILAVPTPGTTSGVGTLILGEPDERILNDTLLHDDTLEPKLAPYEPLGDFILDVDLDAFRSLTPLQTAGAYFDSLIRRAACITVAREQECVASLRFDDELLSADLERALYQRILAASP